MVYATNTGQGGLLNRFSEASLAYLVLDKEKPSKGRRTLVKGNAYLIYGGNTETLY